MIRWGDQSWYIDSIFSKETPFLVDVTQVSLFETASQDTSRRMIGLSFEAQWNFEMVREITEEHKKIKVILEPQSKRELFRSTYFHTQNHYEVLPYNQLEGSLTSTYRYYYYDLFFNSHGDAVISNIKDTCVFKLDVVSGGVRENISTSGCSVEGFVDHKHGRYKNINGHYVFFPRKKERETSFTDKEVLATSEDEKVKVYNLTSVKHGIPDTHTFLEYEEDSSRLEWCIDSLLDLRYTTSIYDFSIQLLQIEEEGMLEVLLSYTNKIVDGDDLVKNTILDSVHILLSIERRTELFRAIPKILNKEEFCENVYNSSELLPRKPYHCAYEYNITYGNQRIVIDGLEFDCGENNVVVDHKPGVYILVDGKFVKQ